jgi:ComF family protein
VCKHCQSRPPHFAAIRSWAVFSGPVRQAIHKLKYKRDVSLGIVLAEPLVGLFTQLGWDCDLILAVPLGLARLKERGYNQSDLLARPLALAVGIPYQSNGLIRVRETRSQVGLTITQRHVNVNGAFQALPEIVSGRRVLVIDDVTTSSATLEACATALMEASSSKVFALTLARAGYNMY